MVDAVRVAERMVAVVVRFAHQCHACRGQAVATRPASLLLLWCVVVVAAAVKLLCRLAWTQCLGFGSGLG